MKRYIILKSTYERPAGGRELYTSAQSQEDILPAVSTERLSERELAELRADPQVKMVIPTMPTRIVPPIGIQASRLAPHWGIKAVRADKSRYTGAGVTVAVLDTGIDRDHPTFAGVTLIEKDFSGHGDGDHNGHGTHCAGSIFGRNDGQRMGVAPGVERALIGKVLRNDGSGQSEMVFQALTWALEQHAHIISLSLGFDFPSLVANLTGEGWPVELATSTALEAYGGNLRMFDALMAVIKAQAAFGVSPLVIAAAGNESRRTLSPDYRIATSLPAAASDVLSVAAIGRAPDNKFTVADFSNIQARLAAPGVDITSAWPGGGLRTLSGTSMACPYVAGVAALWWQYLRERGIQPTARSVSARLIAHARANVFVANTDEADIGQGLVTAP